MLYNPSALPLRLNYFILLLLFLLHSLPNTTNPNKIMIIPTGMADKMIPFTTLPAHQGG
jgi:hypothetical protein